MSVVARPDHPIGVALVLSKIEEGVRRLVKLAGDGEGEVECVMLEIAPIADRAAQRMRAARRGR